MAKLTNLRKHDIRCVVHLDNGVVVKVFNQDKIDELRSNYDNEKMVTVFNPSLKDKEHIIDILDNNTNEDGEISVSGAPFLVLMQLVTDIDFGELTDEEALEIVDNPNDMLEAVNLELNRLLIDIVKQRYETMKTLTSLPEPMLKDMLSAKVKELEEEEAKKLAEEQRKAEIEAKRKELEAQLAALK